MDVVSIGETMVLFTPESAGPMRYSRTFSSRIAGAETNTLIGLAKLGHQAGWISRLGKDEFGAQVLSQVRGEGVDVSQVTLDDQAPTAIFFKEHLQEGRVRVSYYRRHSAASRLTPEHVSEAYIAGARYLYLTGITPALSAGCREALFRAIDIADRHGVPVVFDPNLRRKLWSEEEARQVLTAIAARSAVILAGSEEGRFLFGTGEHQEMAESFHQLGSRIVVIKLGGQGAYYSANGEWKHVPAYKLAKVADPVGAGDGFAAGLLSGLLDGLALEAAVLRGNAVGASVAAVNGDIEGLPDREGLAAFMGGAGEDVAR